VRGVAKATYRCAKAAEIVTVLVVFPVSMVECFFTQSRLSIIGRLLPPEHAGGSQQLLIYVIQAGG